MPLNSLIKRSLSLPLILLLLILAVGCSTIKTPLGDREDGTNWSSLYSGAERDGFISDRLNPPFEKLWSEKIRPFERFKIYPRQQLSVPVMAEGILYIGSTNHKIYAFDFVSGKKIWKYDAEAPIESTPTVGSGLVCFGASKGLLNCLDQKTGELLWSFKTGSEVISSPIITDNTVFFYSSSDRLFALDRRSGKEVWSYRRTTYEMVTPRSRTSPTLTADGERVLQVFSDGMLVCLNAFTGRVLWDVKTYKPNIASGPFRSTPAIYGDTVYVPGVDFKVQARLIEDGRVLRTYDTIKARYFALAGKKGILMASDSQVALQSEKTGKVIWKKPPMKGTSTIASISVSGDTVLVLANTVTKHLNLDYFTKRRGHIIAMSLADGRILWSKQLSSTLTGGVSSSGGRFALLTNKGYIEVWGR